VLRSRLTRLLTGVLVLLALPASAAAGGSSCGTAILTSALQTSLTAWYSPGCYAQATRLLTPDLAAYSDAPTAIAQAAHRDQLRTLHVAVAKKAPAGRVRITFTPPVGAIRVSVFARTGGRFVVAAVGTLSGAGGSLKAKLGRATRIRVSAGYVGSGDTPTTVTLTLRR
jgi:hypothetical protein